MSSVSKPRVRHNRHKQGLNLTLEKLSADFRVYTFIDGLWHEMVSTTQYMGHWEEGFTYSSAVKPAKRKGYLKVLESHGGEDFWIETKTVKIDSRPIPKGIIHFGEIVE